MKTTTYPVYCIDEAKATELDRELRGPTR